MFTSRIYLLFKLVVLLQSPAFSSSQELARSLRKNAQDKESVTAEDTNIDETLYQPNVSIIEGLPGTRVRRVYNIIMKPEGSEWCHGNPMLWLEGHQDREESPWCLQPNGEWIQNEDITLDHNDKLNKVGERLSRGIDRHSCAIMDVNMDGMDDLICLSVSTKVWRE